jgi:hypothetical protein
VIGLVLVNRTVSVKALKKRGSRTSEYRKQNGFIVKKKKADEKRG